MTESTVGLTKDAGWQLGIRRTVPVPLERLWGFVVGEGVPLWLGLIDVPLPLEKGAEYRTAEGVRGTIRSSSPRRRIRLGWQPAGREQETTLQLTLLAAASGSTLAVHQERLSGPEERAELLAHWRGVLDRVEQALTA